MEVRMVLVRVSIAFLVEMMTQGFRCGGVFDVVECCTGLPPGARLVSSFTSDTPFFDEKRAGQNSEAFLIFEHSSFSIVPDGSQIPELRVRFQRKGAPVFKMPSTREEAVRRAIERSETQNHG